MRTGNVSVYLYVIAGFSPAIPLRKARHCQLNRDHRDSALRAGPVMTKEMRKLRQQLPMACLDFDSRGFLYPAAGFDRNGGVAQLVRATES